MKVIPIKTERVDIHPRDSLEEWIESSLKKNSQELHSHDVLVISSKVLSFFEERVVDLSTVNPSEKAKVAIATEDCSPELVQLVMDEADEIIADTKWVMLTRKNGIYCANAGIDKRNVPPGHVVLWPEDPYGSAQSIKEHFSKKLQLNEIAVLIIDSICVPGRLGSLAVAIGYAGIKGYRDLTGESDLFGVKYRYTGLNIVDSFATLANSLMGESTELIPLVIIRDAEWNTVENIDHGEMRIESDEDMFPLG